MLNIIGVVGLILAIAFLIIGAFKGLGPLPLTITAALIAMIANKMPVWDSFIEFYVSGYANTIKSYFAIFVFTALYAKFMEETGSAVAIGFKFIDWFGSKQAMIIGLLLTILLTYGGISLWVVVFAIGPIYYLLFKEANLPRHLVMYCLAAGTSTVSLTTLPGTPSLTNIIPTDYLGTTMTAAPVLSIITTIVMLALVILYGKYAEKKAISSGEVWTPPANYDESKFEMDRSELPTAFSAFTPLIALLATIIIGSQVSEQSSSYLTVIGMIIATVLCIGLNLNKIKEKNLKVLFTVGMANGIVSMGGLTAVVAFGTVIQNAPAFTSVVDWVLSFNLHPYIQGIFSTAVISGTMGSASGGMRLTLQTLSPHFIASGVSLGVLHRLMAIASGTLDSLPHSSAQFLMFQYLDLTHKEAYKHIFWTTVFIPMVIAIGAGFICVALKI